MFTTASAGAASKRSSVSGLFQGKRPFNCRIHQRKTWKASDRTCLYISAAGTPHMAMERLRVDEEQPSTCCCLWTSTTASHSRRSQTEAHRTDSSSSSAICVSTEQLSICSAQERPGPHSPFFCTNLLPCILAERPLSHSLPSAPPGTSRSLTLHTTTGSPQTLLF